MLYDMVCGVVWAWMDGMVCCMLCGMGVDGTEVHVTRVGKGVVPIDDKLVRSFGCEMLCIQFSE